MKDTIIIACVGAFATGVVGIIFFGVKSMFTARCKERLKDRKIMQDLCVKVADLSTRQEGQSSFASAIVENNKDIGILKESVSAIHTRLDDVMGILQTMTGIR